MTVTSCLPAMGERLQAAAAIARAAPACAEGGPEHHATRIALDLEESVREANTLLQAACILQRQRNRAALD